MRDSWCDGLPHRSEHLEHMLLGQQSGGYNEVVVNTAYIDTHLPQAVDAIFFVAGAPAGEVVRARKAHDAFVEKYGASSHPLLCLDPSNLREPFRAARADEGIEKRTGPSGVVVQTVIKG